MTQTFIKRSRITKQTGKPDGRDSSVRLPGELGKALQKAGFTFVDWYVTEEGILLKPVRDAGVEQATDITLPDWG